MTFISIGKTLLNSDYFQTQLCKLWRQYSLIFYSLISFKSTLLFFSCFGYPLRRGQPAFRSSYYPLSLPYCAYSCISSNTFLHVFWVTFISAFRINAFAIRRLFLRHFVNYYVYSKRVIIFYFYIYV